MEYMTIQQEILQEIQKYTTIIIHRHQNPDPDALGSQGGLAEILKSSFPEKTIYCVGKTVQDMGYLLEMDIIEDDLYKGSLVIVTDTANAPRISDDRYKLANMIIKIDHHPDHEPYGDLSWVDTNSSSTSELIYDFYSKFSDQLKLSDNAARLLYAGIVGDTGRFLYPGTTSHTLEVASQLIRHDFDATKLNRQLSEINLNIAHLSGYVYEHIEMDEFGAAKVILNEDILKKYDADYSETHSLVPIPGQVKEVVAWGLYVEQPEGYFRVRLRSKGPSINEIARRHHGGGHPLASGANAKDMKEIDIIYNEIKELVKNYKLSN